MLENNLQVKFFQQIKDQLPRHEKLVHTIMDSLQLTRSQAYRRINGTVPVSLNELKILAELFRISIDDLILEPSNGHIRFSAALRVNHTYLGFLQELYHTISYVGDLPGVKVQYATNEFPIFYTFMCPDLVKFKFYMWNRTFWKTNTSQMPFSLDSANPDELEMANQIQQKYLSIATIEYWHIRMIDNTFSQISYALESGFFKDTAEADFLLEQMIRGLHHVKSMAEQGHKRFLEDSETTQRSKFQLYLSDLPTNVHFLVSSEDRQELFSTFDNPNFMHTRNKTICHYAADWFNNLQNKSVLISESGDKARNQFFHRMETEFSQLRE